MFTIIRFYGNAVLFLLKLLPLSAQARIKKRIKIVVKSKTGDFWMQADSPRKFKRRNIDKEPETVNWINRYIKSGDVFFDVGACVGGYSLLAAAKSASVYSFEPSYSSFAALCDNIFLNKGFKIHPFYVALGNKNGIELFHYSSLEAGAAEHSQKSSLSLPAPFARLDDFADFYKLPAPNHIKIDVDGAEYAVVMGGKETLKKAETIMLEMREDSTDLKLILEELANLGFKVAQKWHRSQAIYNYLFEKIINNL